MDGFGSVGLAAAAAQGAAVTNEAGDRLRLIVYALVGIAILSAVLGVIYWWATGREARRRFEAQAQDEPFAGRRPS